MMNNTLLITDLDGTLLNGEQQISKENRDAISEFKANGGLFTIATGRMESAVEHFVKELELDVPIILYNGAKIVNPLSGTVLYEKTLSIPMEFWGKLKAIGEHEAAVLIYQDSEVYTFSKNHHVLSYEKKDCVQVQLKDNFPLVPITKVLIVSEIKKLVEFEELIKSTGIVCTLVYSESTYLEILPFGVSKGKAVKQLKKYLQRPSIQTICVGDNLNDCSMLLEADRGIAVENAHPELKQIADELTVHHENHSIAKIIKELKSR